MSNIATDSQNKKQRLGRGLGSLLGGSQADLSAHTMAPAATGASAQGVNQLQVAEKKQATTGELASNPESRIWQVSIEKLQPGAFQPRTQFEKEKIDELAQSIKENGILQPIVARRIDGTKMEIIAGERRWRAAQVAGLHEVPVILKVMKNQQALELAIIENIQREDLAPLEEAEAFNRLILEFGLTQQQVAEKVGKDRATVANTLRLLNLVPAVRSLLSAGEISAGHAKVLLGVTDLEKQQQLAQKIAQTKMSVRQAEKVAQSINEESKRQSMTAPAGPDKNVTQRLISGLAEELQKILGTKVNIDYNNSKGKISVHFYSDEELTQIIERLKTGTQN